MTAPRIPSMLARAALALALAAGLGVASVTLAQPARAATTITVGTCDESDLDAAVAQANSDNAGDTISFGCSGTIGLTSTLDITGTMTLDGTGQQVTLSGQGQVGVLSVASGVTLTLHNLTVTGGNTSGSGGGLDNEGGTVNITGSTFAGNTAAGVGGAIMNDGGTVNITDSTIEQNDATGGVGVANLADATVNITNSTFGGNVDHGTSPGSAVNNPPGSTANIAGSLFIMNDLVNGGFGAVVNGGTLSITSSAFSQNDGYGVALAEGTATVTNSSFAVGTPGGIGTITGGSSVNIAFSSFQGDDLLVGPFRGTITGSVVDGICDGAPDEGSYDMESGTSCGFTGTGDLQNAATGLAGGPNFLWTLAQGSPGIDAVPLSLCPVTDENGNPRPDDPAETACDMGATETDYAAAAATATTLTSSPDPSGYGQPATFTATVTPTDGGGTVAFYADGSATAISGCGSQPLTQASGSTYSATCTTSELPAGTHAISASYSGDGGYAGSTGSLAGGQTVNQAPLTITASGGSMPYGATPPAITPAYSGFVNGDDSGSLTTAPACSATATSASPAGTYPSSCSGAADPNYAISYVSGTVTVTPAGTTLAYTGPQQVSAGASLAPAAALSSPAAACQAGQPVSFTLNVNPATGAAGPYPLGSATTGGSGTAAAPPVSTSGWQAGAYTLTASYAGTANCAASAVTAPLVVTTPGLAAAGAGSYTLPGAGPVRFGFIVAKIPHASSYVGGISLVQNGAWKLTGTLSGYVKSAATQGTVTGTGTLSWWNPALNNHHGGWQLADSGVAFTASFSATTKTAPGTFGIQITYTPALPQPATLPNSGPQSLQSGIIAMA